MHLPRSTMRTWDSIFIIAECGGVKQGGSPRPSRFVSVVVLWLSFKCKPTKLHVGDTQQRIASQNERLMPTKPRTIESFP